VGVFHRCRWKCNLSNQDIQTGRWLMKRIVGGFSGLLFLFVNSRFRLYICVLLLRGVGSRLGPNVHLVWRVESKLSKQYNIILSDELFTFTTMISETNELPHNSAEFDCLTATTDLTRVCRKHTRTVESWLSRGSTLISGSRDEVTCRMDQANVEMIFGINQLWAASNFDSINPICQGTF
jgi:hypothetical protein